MKAAGTAACLENSSADHLVVLMADHWAYDSAANLDDLSVECSALCSDDLKDASTADVMAGMKDNDLAASKGLD